MRIPTGSLALFRRRGRLLLGVVLGVVAMPGLAFDQQASLQAAQTTASSHSACTALASFYWEIGDRKGVLVSGSRGGALAPRATTQLPIYSAGKWLDAAYVFQLRNGQLKAGDVRALTLSAGYLADGRCPLATTVAACHKTLSQFDQAAVGRFKYGPGHLQKHVAVDLGQGALNAKQLGTQIVSNLGGALALSYDQPHLGGGARSSAAEYAVFLRRILNGPLLLGALGTHAVCTNTAPDDPATGRKHCPTALYSPTSDRAAGLMEDWTYSLGHWVESDPLVGDGAYSSAGIAGFYPWIDASKMYYGVLARNVVTATSAADSVKCGRLIRKAWLSGVAPPSPSAQPLQDLLPR